MTILPRFLPTFTRNVCLNSTNKIVKIQFRNEGTGRLSDWEKKQLVKAKFFKDVESVPKNVSGEMLKKAGDIGRVRRNMIMGAGTIIAGLFMILLGRHQWKSGRHRVQMDEIRKVSDLRAEGLKEEAAGIK